MTMIGILSHLNHVRNIEIKENKILIEATPMSIGWSSKEIYESLPIIHHPTSTPMT